MATFVPSVPHLRVSDAPARELLARVSRFVLTVLGLLVVVVGVIAAPLPGPMGLPIVVVGLMIVLRNSFKARRRFVKIQRRHPKIVFPLRRLLRREPEVAPVAWQQVLRMERLVLPRRYRFARRSRRWLMRRSRGPGATSGAFDATPATFPAE